MATATKPAPAQSLLTPARASRAQTARHHQIRQSILIIADFCGIACGAILAIVFRFPTTPRLTTAQHLGIAALYAVLIVLFCHTQRLYSAYQPGTFAAEFPAILKSILMATILLGGSLFLTGVKSTSRLIVVATAISALITMTAWRHYRRQALKKAVADGLTCHNVLIVGTDQLAQAVAEHLAHHRHLGFLVVGHLAVTQSNEVHGTERTTAAAKSDPVSRTETLSLTEPRPLGSGPTPKLLGTRDNLKTLIRTHFIDEIILCFYPFKTRNLLILQ